MTVTGEVRAPATAHIILAARDASTAIDEHSAARCCLDRLRKQVPLIARSIANGNEIVIHAHLAVSSCVGKRLDRDWEPGSARAALRRQVL